MNTQNTLIGSEIIYAYTRAQAIADGEQFLLDSKITKEAGYKYPVYITAGVNNIIEIAVNNKRWLNDREGVIWDILYMSRRGIVRKLSEYLFKFQVIITGVGRQKYHYFYIEVSATDIDNDDPCLTIYTENEK